MTSGTAIPGTKKLRLEAESALYWKEQAERAKRRVEELEAEVPYLKQLSVEGGQLDITIEGARRVTALLAESLAKMFRDAGGTNYVQYEVRSGEHDYILLLQLASGKTPHQLRQEAERERDEARADRDIYKHVLDAIADFLKTGAVDAVAESKSTTFLAVRELKAEFDEARKEALSLRHEASANLDVAEFANTTTKKAIHQRDAETARANAAERALAKKTKQLDEAILKWLAEANALGRETGSVLTEMRRAFGPGVTSAWSMGVFSGPCLHGRAPYTRCDECEGLEPREAFIKSLGSPVSLAALHSALSAWQTLNVECFNDGSPAPSEGCLCNTCETWREGAAALTAAPLVTGPAPISERERALVLAAREVVDHFVGVDHHRDDCPGLLDHDGLTVLGPVCRDHQVSGAIDAALAAYAEVPHV